MVSDNYYYADGKKVPITVSPRFMAVQTVGEGKSARDMMTGLAGRMSSMMAPAQILDIPDYNLAVIALPPARAGESPQAVGKETMRSLLAGEPAVSEGPEVYELADANSDQALIPVGEVILKFKDSLATEARSKFMEKHKLEIKRSDYPEPGAYLCAVKNDAITTANTLQELDQVEYAQPNFVHLSTRLIVEHATELASSRLFSDLQRALEEGGEAAMAAPLADPGFGSQWNLKKIKAPEAWAISQGNPNISIAIVDEGCDMTHEDLVYKTGYDAYDGDSNPQPLGNDAHGTACAGVAAAMKDNNKGGIGVAPACKVVGIRIARGVGGGFWDTTDAKVADGIRKAVDLGADILSHSYRVGPSTAVTNAFNYTQTNGRGGLGCPNSIAAGNFSAPETATNRVVTYPATLSPTIRGLMAVSATNEWDQLKSPTSLDGENWWGSCYGPQVDVAAPGVHIYATDIMGSAGYGAGNYVSNFNGTSSATPHVAGLMGLILSVDPALRSWEVEDIIKLSADDLGSAGRDERFGFGRINARRALEAASRIWYEIAVVPVFLGTGKECFMRINLRMYNPGINTIRLDALTVTSHNPAWTAEIDRFEYRPNPGNVMASRSGQEVRFNKLLLRANGTQASWSYRWALNWNYTYWRPAAPSFPLVAANPADAAGTSVESRVIHGQQDGVKASEQRTDEMADRNGSAGIGDVVTVDRTSHAITIVVR